MGVQPGLRETEIRRLDTLSRNALENLQRVFPYGVRYANGTFRSWFCTEKPHSMTHWADNYAAVGRTRIISESTSPTEARPRMKTAVRSRSRQRSPTTRPRSARARAAASSLAT